MAKGIKLPFFKRPARTKYVALTTETMYVIKTFPREARLMLEKLIPVFDVVRAESFDASRWLSLLHKMPEEILTDLPKLKVTKTKQAIHVTVMLAVFARTLHYPRADNALCCDMSDEELHKATNRIIIFYLPIEHFLRQGYLKVDLPHDPFGPWTDCTMRYTTSGLAVRSTTGSVRTLAARLQRAAGHRELCGLGIGIGSSPDMKRDGRFTRP